MIVRKVIEGQGTENNAWYLACSELINTIFHLQPSPEKISHYIIIKLSKSLFINKAINNLEPNIDHIPNFNSEAIIQESNSKIQEDEFEGMTNVNRTF